MIPADELRVIVAWYEGQSLTLFEIYSVADELTQFYRDQGYSVASVTVPAQKISSGTVKLEVIEGRIGAISIKGSKANRAIRVVAYDKQRMEELVKSFYYRFGELNPEPEAFEVFDKRDRHPDWLKIAEPVDKRVGLRLAFLFLSMKSWKDGRLGAQFHTRPISSFDICFQI